MGEIRGPEAIDMISAMNTGHDGSLSTGHSNSVEDMISRLETMILMGTDIPLQAIRKQIVSSLDIVVHLGRLRDKTRKVLEIVEIGDYIDGEIQYNPLYRFEELPVISENTNYNGEQTKVMGVLRATGNSLKNTRKLKAAGMFVGSERSAGDE